MAYARSNRQSSSARRTSSSRSTSRTSRSTSRGAGRSSASRSGGSTRSTRSWGSVSAGSTSGRTRSSSSQGTRSRTARRTSASTNYAPFKQQCEQKIKSFQQLKNQTQGPAKTGRPSAATLTRWANWVGQGAIVHELAGSKIMRITQTAKQCGTPAACQRALQGKYGKTTIKGVIKSKNGRFLVATAPKQRNGRPFCFPS